MCEKQEPGQGPSPEAPKCFERRFHMHFYHNIKQKRIKIKREGGRIIPIDDAWCGALCSKSTTVVDIYKVETCVISSCRC